jgi:hypothetical protein
MPRHLSRRPSPGHINQPSHPATHYAPTPLPEVGPWRVDHHRHVRRRRLVVEEAQEDLKEAVGHQGGLLAGARHALGPAAAGRRRRGRGAVAVGEAVDLRLGVDQVEPGGAVGAGAGLRAGGRVNGFPRSWGRQQICSVACAGWSFWCGGAPEATAGHSRGPGCCWGLANRGAWGLTCAWTLLQAPHLPRASARGAGALGAGAAPATAAGGPALVQGAAAGGEACSARRLMLSSGASSHGAAIKAARAAAAMGRAEEAAPGARRGTAAHVVAAHRPPLHRSAARPPPEGSMPQDVLFSARLLSGCYMSDPGPKVVLECGDSDCSVHVPVLTME